MNVEVEFFMLNHEETCFNQKQNHFHEFCVKKCECNLELVGRSHGKFDEEIVSSIKKCALSRYRNW